MQSKATPPRARQILLNRRSFLTKTAAAAVGLAAINTDSLNAEPSTGTKFKLRYAPSFGMFKEHAGGDPIDQIAFIADAGFTAVFDNGLMQKPKDLQEKIANELAKRDIMAGPFVAGFGINDRTFVDKAFRDTLVKGMNDAVEVAKRTNCKWALITVGQYDMKLDWDYQTAIVIDNLKYCAEVCEPSGLVAVIEPLNRLVSHPGYFLTKIAQAYQICKAVNSPSCKIVDDIYHQQITEGNLIPNIDTAWDHIAAFHLGDTPGRNEPATGEINYKNIFKHIHQKRYNGVLCMEHGKSIPGKEGETALIEAYRLCDDF